MAYPLSDIGSIDKFKNDFILICDEHLRDGRAKAFCFILDDPIKKTLKMSGVARSAEAVLQINKLAGEDLTVFYIDAGALSQREYAEQVLAFNQYLLKQLGGFEVNNRYPCLVFFKIHKDMTDNKSYVCDIECIELSRPVGFLFSDMRDAMQRYIARLNAASKGDEPQDNYFFRIVKAAIPQVPLEVFKGVVGHLTSSLLP